MFDLCQGLNINKKNVRNLTLPRSQLQNIDFAHTSISRTLRYSKDEFLITDQNISLREIKPAWKNIKKS